MFQEDVTNILSKMHSQHEASDKGSYGEEAVFAVCESIYQEQGGILVHSYSYKTVPDLKGNIKRVGGQCHVENLGSTTEIDVLLVTPYRIFPIEVKAYKARLITLYNDRITGCSATEKSPVHQNEMHCRHLYPSTFQAIPDGISKYIVPLVVFADECSLKDLRTEDNKNYIGAVVLNNLRQYIDSKNKCLRGYTLDLPAIEARLRSVMVSNSKFLPFIK